MSDFNVDDLRLSPDDIAAMRRPRRSLSDVLSSSGADLRQAFADAVPAGLLPAGEYVCVVTDTRLMTSRSNQTPGYELTLEVVEGPYAGQRLWHTIWLTIASMPMAKRELVKLRIQSLDELERPLPRYRLLVKVVQRVSEEDEDQVFNRVKSFKVLGVDEPVVDPFAPKLPKSVEDLLNDPLE